MSNRFCSRILWPTLLTFGILPFAKAQTIHPMTAPEAIDMAKKYNIQVKASVANLELQEQTNKEITALALPKITGTGAATEYFNIPVTLVPGDFFPGGVPGSFKGVQFQQKFITSGGINLTQTVFDGSVFVGLKARTAALDYYRKAIDLSVENLSVQVYKTYYQLLVSRTQMELQDSNVRRAEKLLHDTRVLNENGFAEKLDVDKAAVQLTNLVTAKQNTETNIINGFTFLKFLVGVPAQDSIILTTDFSEATLLGGVPIDTGYSYQNRNDFQSLQIQKQLNDFDIQRYQSAYYPTLNLNAAYQKNAAGNTYDLFTSAGTWFTSSYIGLSLNVPIFEGFAKNARLKKARITAALTNEQVENLKLSIGQEVAQARNTFLNAIRTMTSQKSNMQTADLVYSQTKKKFESGLSTNTDLSNAQQDLITAQYNYVNALYTAVIAKIDFLKAIGKI